MNKNNKYRVLVDYDNERFTFLDGEYETVDEAVKVAIKNSLYSFIIVKIINWKAIDSDSDQTTQEEDRRENQNEKYDQLSDTRCKHAYNGYQKEADFD